MRPQFCSGQGPKLCARNVCALQRCADGAAMSWGHSHRCVGGCTRLIYKVLNAHTLTALIVNALSSLRVCLYVLYALFVYAVYGMAV